MLLRLLRDPARQGVVADSAFERLTQRLLLAAGIPPPVLQHRVELPNGRSARIDLAWPDAKWGIECHSREHHFGHQPEQRDHDRDHQLAMAGWQLTYLTWRQTNDPAYVVKLARTMLRLSASSAA